VVTKPFSRLQAAFAPVMMATASDIDAVFGSTTATRLPKR
jgi:hypothetical protein